MTALHMILTSTLNSRIENLVDLRARAKLLTAEIKAVEADFKADGLGLFEGELHNVKVTEVSTTRVDYKSIAEKQGISTYMREKYSKVTESKRLTISVKNKAI